MSGFTSEITTLFIFFNVKEMLQSNLYNSRTFVRLQFCTFPSAPLGESPEVEIKLIPTGIICHVSRGIILPL